MRIVDLYADDHQRVREAAALLAEGLPAGWPDAPSALAEVRESLAEDRISRVALADDGAVAGWIGGRRAYGGNVWELHPLVVGVAWRRRGVGRALVADLEARVRERGGLTVWLGTDDETGQTSLFGRDLFPAVLEHLAALQSGPEHPAGFYRRLGYAVVGVVPDANGLGKPDIWMAKSVARPPA